MTKISMPILIFFAAGLLATSAAAAGAGCKLDSVKTVKKDGSLIFLKSGISFQPMLDDFFSAYSWKPGEPVRMCAIDPKNTASRTVGYFNLENLKRAEDLVGIKK